MFVSSVSAHRLHSRYKDIRQASRLLEAPQSHEDTVEPSQSLEIEVGGRGVAETFRQTCPTYGFPRVIDTASATERPPPLLPHLNHTG